MASHNVNMPSSSALASSHRLPTVSASQALGTLHAKGSRTVRTGLSQLDKHLAPHGLPGRTATGGYMRGKVTEIFGPPGVGKTAFGIQAAVSALREGHKVVWLDAACAPLVPQRFNDVLLAANKPVLQASSAPPKVPSTSSMSPDEMQSQFHHYAPPTLAHLLALFVRPPSSFPPPNTSLIVIDSLSTLFDNAYPRNADDRASKNRSDQARWAAGRKFAVMNELISTLTRVAAMHDIALLVTSQTITRMRAGSRALLVPAISGAEWESGISTRLVLFRDWVPGQGKWSRTDSTRLQKTRFAGVLKVNGVLLAEEGGVGNVVPFAVEEAGLRDMDIAAVDIAAPVVSSEARPKRRFAEIDDEGREELDSDELYDWLEDDEVAAEGLLINEAPTTAGMGSATSGATPLAASTHDTESTATNLAEKHDSVVRPPTL
ncbi:P-loop containing nucleoside triphosphate hydrolase protein [Bimuria novae-zelandiae CBS 107.79]|uniref:P-loop containing nucleoside triphosphate hydrolase protein n=1 Tax=Bimuria novae-zelandiae CBS 107.79 TaxID=1447943 RepID=A0A6A5VUD7_9PLEO|nr:P-loop containing nucleoside triphosphate hydrolase protein [Bimuria novae-zelandiae CBS 107.79]